VRGRQRWPAVIEWVGGRFAARFYVAEPEPYRPDVILCVERPSGLIVGVQIDEAGRLADDVAARLAGFLDAPMARGAARPHRIRVADAAVAEALRRRLADTVPVVVAPTPELAPVFDHLSEAIGGGGGARAGGYLEDGRIAPAEIARLFAAAGRLYRAAPWKAAADRQALAVDVPTLGIAGACLSIIGALGENLGFVLFDSMEGFTRFRDSMPDDGGPPAEIDVRGYLVSLNFERRAMFPAIMKREIVAHGWAVAGPAAFPVLTTLDPDGVPRPTTVRDVRLATACADALATFHMRHPWVFRGLPPAPVVDEVAVDAGVPATVRLEAPHPGARLEWEPQEAAPPVAVRVGRNDPCPCGSGRKYKRCHLAADEAAARRAPSSAAALHERDRRLADDMRRFAERRWPALWTAALDRLVRRDPEGAPPIAIPWLLYHEQFDGRAVVEWFLDARGASLPVADHDWLASQRAARLAVSEVVSVAPGEVVLRDLLSGEERAVVEHSAAETLAAGDTVLTRVVDHAGMSVITMLYPQPLRPSEGVEVARAGRRAAGTRARTVPAGALGGERVARALLDAFTAAACRRRSAVANARLQNTDGHPLLLTTDRFDFDPAARAPLLERLAELATREGAGGLPAFRFEAAAAPTTGLERVTVGVAQVGSRELRVETNSRERADALRAQIEAACAGLVSHRTREHADPRAALAHGAPAGTNDEPPSGPEVDALLLDLKRRHYATWADIPLPALRGQTPRTAAGTARGRREVSLLLRDMEHGEARLPAGQRFDFGLLREELGIEA
jgi:hypothetical protein